MLRHFIQNNTSKVKNINSQAQALWNGTGALQQSCKYAAVLLMGIFILRRFLTCGARIFAITVTALHTAAPSSGWSSLVAWNSLPFPAKAGLYSCPHFPPFCHLSWASLIRSSQSKGPGSPLGDPAREWWALSSASFILHLQDAPSVEVALDLLPLASVSWLDPTTEKGMLVLKSLVCSLKSSSSQDSASGKRQTLMSCSSISSRILFFRCLAPSVCAQPFSNRRSAHLAVSCLHKRTLAADIHVWRGKWSKAAVHPVITDHAPSVQTISVLQALFKLPSMTVLKQSLQLMGVPEARVSSVVRRSLTLALQFPTVGASIWRVFAIFSAAPGKTLLQRSVTRWGLWHRF